MKQRNIPADLQNKDCMCATTIHLEAMLIDANIAVKACIEYNG